MPPNAGHWTVETLKEHIEAALAQLRTYTDQRFDDQGKAVSAALAAAEKAVVAALASAEKAIDKAEINSEKWRENANEWRGSMDDREVKFATRVEVSAELKALAGKIEGLEKFANQGVGGRGAMDSGRAWIVAGISVAGFILMIAWKLMGR